MASNIETISKVLRMKHEDLIAMGFEEIFLGAYQLSVPDKPRIRWYGGSGTMIDAHAVPSIDTPTKMRTLLYLLDIPHEKDSTHRSNLPDASSNSHTDDAETGVSRDVQSTAH